MECCDFYSFLFWKNLPLLKCIFYNFNTKYYRLLYFWDFHSNQIWFAFNQFKNIIFIDRKYYIYDADANNNRDLIEYTRIYNLYGNCIFFCWLYNNSLSLFYGNWRINVTKLSDLFCDRDWNFWYSFQFAESVLIIDFSWRDWWGD